MNATAITPVLDYFSQLADGGARRSVDVVLQGLAPLIGADAIGMASLDGAAADLAYPSPPVPERYPWKKEPRLLHQLRGSLTAGTHRDEAGEWLMSVVGETLIWVLRSKRKAWTEAERWSWMFASQMLMRGWGPAAGAARLEQAAVVTSRLSHDFGNCLTGIMGFTELGLAQAAPDSLLARYLTEVLASARQGAEWLRRLHLFCRRANLQTWPALLSCVLADEEARLRSAGAPGLRLIAELPADLPLLDIDAASLQTVLAELVTNSREACGDAGTVRVAARLVELMAADCQGLLGAARPGSFVELTVSDDGPGISPEDRDRLLREPFFSTKPRQRGLGLLIVYGAMQRCRGGLRLPGPDESRPGLTVQLYLPVARNEGPTLGDGETPAVLLVQPDPHLYEPMKQILEAHGCPVTVATSPEAALNASAAPARSFTLVVSEVLLPKMSGCDLARRVLDRDEDVKFLFLHTQSSFHGLVDEEMLKRFALLRWPLTPLGFLNSVQTALAPSGAGR